MKITIELPDNTKAAFINYVVDEGGRMVMTSKGIGEMDIEAGYIDCSEYEVAKNERRI